MPTIEGFGSNNFRSLYYVFFNIIKYLTASASKKSPSLLPSHAPPIQLSCKRVTLCCYSNIQTHSNKLKITKTFITKFSLLPQLPMELTTLTAGRGNKRPNPSADVDASIQQEVEDINSEAISTGSTVDYDRMPLPPPPQRTKLDVVPADSGSYAGYLARTAMLRDSIEARRMQGRRELVQRGMNTDYYGRYVPQSDKFIVVQKTNPLATDPLVQLEASRMVDFNAKIAELTPIMTDRQREIIRKMQVRATTYRGSKHGDLPKTPTTKQKEKILYRAIELFSQRRAAQLKAQARRAAKERHALQAKKRTVALADGTVVNYNKRSEKKQASDNIKKSAKIQAQIIAGTERARYVRRNKAERVAVATAHGRKISRKDLPTTDE